ncbi:MAG: hypothetical protein WB511_13015 [Nitrososphaeraceae archaeon]
MIRGDLHLSKGPSKIGDIKSIGTLTITKYAYQHPKLLFHIRLITESLIGR